MQEDQQTPFNFVDVSATKRIFSLKKRIRAVTGGTSASKTISILVWLIDYCQSPKNRNKIVTVVSESFPHLTGGAMRDFESIMKDRGYWNDKLWVRSPKAQYTFETGNIMEFISVSTYGKAHGPRRNILFINECNNLPYNIADQLITRTKEVIWLDWNPINEFWFYEEMLGKRDDIDFITLTYKDNEALDENTIKEIESHRHNKAWWTVYGLGQLGNIEGRIYTNWTVIEDIPDGARLVRRGLDFGYSIDPTVIEDIYQYNQSYVIDEICYMKGLSNRSIADIILNQKDKALVVADGAEPKSIDEISSYGVPIIASNKGPGSVNQGIQYVQDQTIYITARSVKTIKAYRNYIWMKDKNGVIINTPDDSVHEWSNPLDAIRYGLESLKPRQPRPLQRNFGGVQPLLEGTLA